MRAALTATACAALAAAFAAGNAAAGGPKAAKPDKSPKGAAAGSVVSGPQSAQGVVQSLTATAVVLRELDGSTVSVPVDPRTRIVVNGKPAALADVEPGFVGSASWTGGKSAPELDTFASASPAATSAEVVQSVLPDAVLVTTAGGTVKLRVNSKTRLFVGGELATLRAIKPGYTLAASAGGKGNSPAAELRFLRPG